MNMKVENLTYIKTKLVFGNPEQPRKVFTREHIAGLADSIKAEGQQQPGRIIPIENIIDLAKADWIVPEGVTHMVIAGESRLHACEEAGVDYQAIVVGEKMTRQKILIQALVENEQRQDPTPIENARAYDALRKSGLTISQIAEQTGKRHQYIRGRLELLKIDEEYQKALEVKEITIGQAGQMARLSSGGQHAFMKLIRKGKIKSNKDAEYAADAILDAEQQTAMFSPPTEMDKATYSAVEEIERRIGSIYKQLLRYDANSNLTIFKKVPPGQTIALAEKVKLLIKGLLSLEKQLRQMGMKGHVRQGK